MYEQLIKRLRNVSMEFGQLNHVSVLLLEAADAIEGLSHAVDQMTEWRKNQWIPVTERLPNAYESVLLQFPNNQAAGFCDRDGCWGVYSGDGLYTEIADNEQKPTHWAKKLPEPPKEEADA